MKTIEDKENFLFNRREVKFLVEAEKNPSFTDALNVAEKEFKADRNLTAVKKIKGKFGRNTFLVSAFIYKTLEDLEKSEGKKEEKKEEVKKNE